MGHIQGTKNLQSMSTHLYKIKQICKRVTMEGEHTCLLLLQHDQTLLNQEPPFLEILPILNAPYQSQKIQIQLDDIRIVHIYRYLFQYKAVRIVTKRADEFIFEFQKIKHAHKVLEVLIGNSEKRSIITENKNSIGSVEVDQVLEKEIQPMCKYVNNHMLTNIEYY